MKKISLSIAVAAFSASAAFSQIAASNNVIDTVSNTAIYNFDGTAYDNYGTFVPGIANSLVPSSLYSDKGYGLTAGDVIYGDGTLTLNKNNKIAYNKMVILFGKPAVVNGKDYGQPRTLDLSDKNNQRFKIYLNSSVAIPQFMMFFLQGGNYNDNATTITSLNAGCNVIEFSGFDWNQFGSPVDKAQALDSTQIEGFALYFRTAYNDANPYTATIKIDKIEVGFNSATLIREAYTCVDAIADDVYANSGSLIYPNPISSNGELTVSGLSGNVSLKLLNSIGSTIASSESSTLDLNNINAGLYFLEVNNNGILKTEKIMVK